MGVPLPHLAPPWSWVVGALAGQEYPQGDEDALRRLAAAWYQMAVALVESGDTGNSATAHVSRVLEGMSGDALNQLWARYTDGGNSTFGALATQCEKLAAQCLDAANEIEYTKLVI